MWQEFVPSKANVDSIPILCGNITVQHDTPEFPDPNKHVSLKDLLLATAKMHPNILVDNEKALSQAEVLWLQQVQTLYFQDIITFLQTLKGNKLKSIEGKTLVVIRN